MTSERDLTETKERIGLELYDLVWNVCDIANKLGIDLDRAFEQKAALNAHPPGRS
jgi:NTP pyrophosphatase (non-canonical NTP hydrolase)